MRFLGYSVECGKAPSFTSYFGANTGVDNSRRFAILFCGRLKRAQPLRGARSCRSPEMYQRPDRAGLAHCVCTVRESDGDAGGVCAMSTSNAELAAAMRWFPGTIARSHNAVGDARQMPHRGASECAWSLPNAHSKCSLAGFVRNRRRVRVGRQGSAPSRRGPAKFSKMCYNEFATRRSPTRDGRFFILE